MQGFVCVYRKYSPKRREWKKTQEAAATDSALRKFMDEYRQDDCYYDWGDDPAFFAAQEFMGDVHCASWGVCRRDVRSRLNEGDLVIFFCAKPIIDSKRWNYFYIGFGTVKATISRWEIWQNRQYKKYRRFYNVLAEPKGSILTQRETFHPYHPNWQKRIEAPYILFEEDKSLSHFNLTNPLYVATYDGTIPEKWNSDDSELTARIEKLLFIERGFSRRLRTSPTGYGHRHINLTQNKKGAQLNNLRQELLELSGAITTQKAT